MLNIINSDCERIVNKNVRESNMDDLMKQCHQFHQQSNCCKPSQDPKVTSVRDKYWQEKGKPEIFFDSRKFLHKVMKSIIFNKYNSRKF